MLRILQSKLNGSCEQNNVNISLIRILEKE
jgi:hypothetical protein